MPLFHYRARTQQGKLIEGNREFKEENQVLEWLYTLGHTPIKVEIATQPGGNGSTVLHRWVQFRQLRGQLLIFTRELSSLLKAGIPLEPALASLARVLSSPLKEIIEDVHDQLRQGKPFSAALRNYPRIFDQTYVVMITSGERTGTLAEVVHQLYSYLNRIDALRQRITSLLIYPAVLMAFSLISTLLILLVVVPKFAAFFVDESIHLPLLSRIVFAVSEGMQSHWLLITVLIIAAVILLVRGIISPRGRNLFHRWLMVAPLLGGLSRRSDAARFCTVLGTLLNKRVAIVEAAELAVSATQNQIIRQALSVSTQELSHGLGLSSCVERAGVLPPLVHEMVLLGERSGRLGEMVEELAGIYEREVEHTLNRIIALAEPALIIVMGGFIGLIITALLTAVLSLNEAVF